MSIKSEVTQVTQRAVARLGTLRDEARLRAHLLSLDAKQRWGELESAVGNLEVSASREGNKASEGVLESARELTRNVNEFMEHHMSFSPGLLTNVRTVMTSKVQGCEPGASLNRAAQLMWECDCGVLPVVSDGKVLGIVTDRDLCMACYTQGKALSEIPIESAMARQVFCCAPDDSIGDALALMASHKVRRLPVEDGSGKLVGMLSLADVERFARKAASQAIDAALAETLSAIAERSAPPPLIAAAE